MVDDIIALAVIALIIGGAISKEGAFLLAKRANAPIVVMATHGTNRITKRMLWKRTVIDLNVLEVIDRETVKSLPLAEISANVRSSIEADLAGQE